MSASSTPRRRPGFPGSLTDLHRFRKTVHGHDGSSRIVMVRKTDQRTFASIGKGQEPKLETVTRETIETFRGQRTECKITTETKDCEEKFPPDLIEALTDKVTKNIRKTPVKKKRPAMSFEDECLRAHNEYRKKHGVVHLELDRKMCREAQNWADYLIRKKILQHSNGQFGENLYRVMSTSPTFTMNGREAVENWYSEIQHYTFGIEPTSLAAGHFTQVVWKESRKMGVAMAKSIGNVVVVALYDPPGNMIGSFTDNVPPIGGFCSNNNINNNNNDECFEEKLSKLSISTPKFIALKEKNGTEGNFEDDFLKAHNEYRRRHGVPALKLDKKLCKYSEEWARHLAAKNILEHRPNCNYGENIYCMYSSDPNFTITGHSPVDVWYEEVQFHPFGREPNSLKSGHFTQVVWKASQTLGVGVAKNNQGSIYVVANYSPAGNFVGNYVENVPSPLKESSPAEPVLEKKVTIAEEALEDIFPQYAIDGLKVHNEYRRKHGVPELKLSKKLCKYAQDWADTCSRSGSMCHRANNPYGENIFCVYSSDYSHVPTARDAVKEWYDEMKKHTFGIETVNHGTLHFTQVVWKSSTELGFAMSKNHKGETYVVANYNPRGNCIGQFANNVLRPRI